MVNMKKEENTCECGEMTVATCNCKQKKK